MLLSCFCIAFVVLLATSVFIWHNRRQFNQSVKIMLIGIIGVITILIFPMYKSSYDSATSLLFSLLYALRALTGCQSVDVSHKVLIEGWLYYGYYALLYVAFIIAPIFTTGFLVSIFGNLSDKVRYAILPGKTLHIFSELNEGSVLLCESIDHQKADFVFCNTILTAKDKDTDLVKRARKFGAVILDKSELDLKLHKKQVCFYQLSKSKDYNANSTIALIEKHRDDKEKNIKIATFSSGVTTELLLDSIDKGHIRVKLLDEVKYSCYALLDQAPLYEGVRNGKLSALIIGCDYTGLEMLKAIFWCGQLENVDLEINVIDKQACDKQKQFRLNCPDINPEKYNIKFIQADVKSSDFEDALDQYCKDTNYVVVVTGDDKLNIDTAVYLRKYFLRRDRKHFHNRPKINLRVRDALKNKQMDALSDANIKAYELYAFGSIEKTFSIHNLLGTDLEKMAIGVHLAYNDVLNGTQEQRDEAMEEYYCKEYNQRSSFATALHIKYKLFSCGIKVPVGESITEEQVAQFEILLQDSNVMERVAILEHSRWNAFMRTEGYSVANPEDVKTYYALSPKHTHIHYLAKLHPTLLEWDELDALSKELSCVMDKKFDFKQNDYDIVRRLPDILRSAL